MLLLTAESTHQLLAEPESGMGYQVVDAIMGNQQTRRGVVYNADLLVFDDERPRLRDKTYASVLQEARRSVEAVQTLRVLPRSAGPSAVVRENLRYGSQPGPAKDAPKKKTAAGEILKRFSAYRNDKRVRSDRSLLPGTYSTTAEDAKNVKTGRDAVRRYALPNTDPASFVFTIAPHSGTTIQYGIVEPANGQPGGGVEVLFADGTQTNTVIGPDKIPDG